jgi:hypothetical protein
MEFLLYLTPEAREILDLVYKKNYIVKENIELCKKHKEFFGYADSRKKFVICTDNIKKSGHDVKFYINETIYHESVHVAHYCNGFNPFGISLNKMRLSDDKLYSLNNSLSLSNSKSRIEYEAYWMEDKPNEVKYVLKKYCF